MTSDAYNEILEAAYIQAESLFEEGSGRREVEQILLTDGLDAESVSLIIRELTRTADEEKKTSYRKKMIVGLSLAVVGFLCVLAFRWIDVHPILSILCGFALFIGVYQFAKAYSQFHSLKASLSIK